MYLRTAAFPVIMAVVSASLPASVTAQAMGTAAQRAENRQAAARLSARIASTDTRIDAAREEKKITKARATALHRQVARTRTSMTSLSRKQGFVSAGEMASYERTLAAIDVELDRRGVARSYGNDGLVAPTSAARN